MIEKVVCGSWLSRKKIIYIPGLQTGIIHLITTHKSRSFSCFYFLSGCPHLPSWVCVLWILSTFHSWVFPQVRNVATNLNAAEEALEAYQREKQQRLNELLVVIPLKLHQVTGLERSSHPKQNHHHTQAFPENSLGVTSRVKSCPLLAILPVEWHPNFSYLFSDCYKRVFFPITSYSTLKVESFQVWRMRSLWLKNGMLGGWNLGSCTNTLLIIFK